MSPQQSAAFAAAAGYQPGYIGLFFTLLVGAVVVLWAADMVRRLGIEGLDDPRRLPMLLFYKLRVLIIVLLLIYLLT